MVEDAQGSLPAGKVIAGRFRIDRLIGRGGMGEVYAAKNVGTGRDVALKMIRGAAGAEQTRRFLREAKAATAIQHPNVIEVLDVFEDQDGTPVMVMELLRGEPLSALRKRRGAMPLHEVAAILLPVAEALRAAHEKGIVHRDLKPDNIFLSEPAAGGRVPKVLDFGIAKVLDPTSISSETQGGNTSTGSILGTPHYMSLEQAMSEKDIDHRADIWAMGVILFEALTGRRPLEFENLGQMYTAFLQGEVPSIRAAVPDLPADVASVIDRCLQKQRDARLDDLGPLVDVLGRYVDASVEGAQAGGSVVSVLPSRAGTTLSGTASAQTAATGVKVATAAAPSRRTRTLGIAGVAAVVVAASVGVAAMLGRSPAVSQPPEAEPVKATAAPARAPADTAPPPVVSAAGAVPTAGVATAAATAASTAAPKGKAPVRTAASAAPTAAATAATAVTSTPPAQSAKGIVTSLPY